MTRKLAHLITALSLTLALAGPISDDLTQPDPTQPGVVQMSSTPNPAAGTITAAYNYRVSCRPMVGYSYVSTLTLAVTTYNGVAYITNLFLHTTYPKGGYTDVTWGGKTGRVHTGGDAYGQAGFSGWKAPLGSRATVRQALSLPFAADPACTVTVTLPAS